ncbi:hypothetical protein GUJ93_ZPchr0015g6952 [Zizania palustris]|uniref:Uncharacterized protein n=1 Tax=Zizania palustris TaxID=103762 RepID=A0A8J5TB13_ZIZPA|nr:hypothetical protein GUJ93_ZPchr0015g6952 [Zizania palustris]
MLLARPWLLRRQHGLSQRPLRHRHGPSRCASLATAPPLSSCIGLSSRRPRASATAPGCASLASHHIGLALRQPRPSVAGPVLARLHNATPSTHRREN